MIRRFVFLLCAFALLPAFAFSSTDHSGMLAQSEEWTKAGSPHVLRGTFEVPPGMTLTIGPGAVIAASEDAQFVIAGALVVAGAPQERVLMTGFDQNQWGGIVFAPHSTGFLSNVTFATSSQYLFRVESADSIVMLDDSLQYSPIAEGAIGMYVDGGNVIVRGNVVVAPLENLYSIALAPNSAPIANGGATPLSPGGDIDVQHTSSASPQGFALEQNYPNPFSPATTIRYAIPRESRVVLSVYDIAGKEVERLVNGDQQAGEYAVQFIARGIPSGMYFYRLHAGGYAAQKTMLLVR